MTDRIIGRDILRSMKFAPEYVTYVLNENFEDAKALLLSPLMAIHYAHLVMLADAGHRLGPRTRARCATRSTRSRRTTIRRVKYDGTCEDLFFYIERLIVAACGDDVAGRLHTARSPQRHRHDDVPDAAARVHSRPARGDASSCAARCSTSPTATATRSSPCTRTPSGRSRRRSRTTCSRSSNSWSATASRLKAAYDRTNVNPLGACAITGTGFPIDRQLTSELLGFCGPTGNTYGSIATVDYLLESTSAAAVLLAGLGRFVQDLLLWCTAEFGYLRLRRRLRAGQQHHAAEAQPGRDRARARDRQQGARPGAGHRPDRAQHAVRRHRRHRGRSAAAGVRDVPRRARAR